MSQFASAFSKEEMWSQPVSQIPWGTIFNIFQQEVPTSLSGGSMSPQWMI